MNHQKNIGHIGADIFTATVTDTGDEPDLPGSRD